MAVTFEAWDSHEQVARLDAPTVLGNTRDEKGRIAADELRAGHLRDELLQTLWSRQECHLLTIYAPCSTSYFPKILTSGPAS